MTNRVLFDTTIYGRFFEDKKEGANIAEKIQKEKPFIIHDFKLIRDELRKTPKNIKIKSKSLKNALIILYDKLVSGKKVFDDKKIDLLAKEYYKEYRNLNGMVGKKRIFKDMKIVACASIKNYDIVYSDDKNSLMCAKALESYKIVNIRKKLRTPNFIDYKTLKRALN